MPQVSVIVLTYNPDPAKLRQTLTAAARQREVDYEILISDDGSARKDFSFLPTFMQQLGVENWRLLDNAENKGTVQNCLSAVREAQGDYVFLTSPGDYLFDDFVLRDCYRFAEKHQASLCFGDAVFYSAADGQPRVTQTYGTPAQPQLYAPTVSKARMKAAFFGGSWVIGASYFRRRTVALSYLEKIASGSVYTEDTTSTAAALACGERLCYVARNVVWYEDGTGVSTSANQRWKEVLAKDLVQSYTQLKAEHPKDPYVDILYRNVVETNRTKRIVGKLLRHPLLFVRILLCKRAKKIPLAYTAEDMQRLTELLSIE